MGDDMKSSKIIMVFVAGLSLACVNKNAEETDLATQKQKVSYSIGINVGTDFRQQELDLDLDALAQGLKDGFLDRERWLTEEERQDVMSALQKELMEKQAEKNRVLGEKNKKEGEAFLSENKAKDGVITLPSGLQYQVLSSGSGPSPKETDRIKAHYISWLLDGTEFNNSYTQGEPAVFGLDQVIPGWREALQLMKVGDKWKLFVPGELGYGAQGFVNIVGPHATLIFEVELLGIEN
jgi:FKBP-type peptidyl-prolyl cis-trans isomerase FklB